MDALGNATNYAYTVDNLLKEIRYANGATLTAKYDLAGNMISETDPEGHTTAYEYDPVGRMTAVTDALGNTTRYDYDAADNLARVTDALGHVTSYTYDALGNLTSETDALGNTVMYSYTPEGWLETVTDGSGHVTRYSYDKTGNILTADYAGEQTETNTYNELGLLTTVTTVEGNTLYQYDDASCLLSVTQPNGETVSYTYDSHGNRATMTYPNGKTVKYTYDDMNRLIAVKDADGETTKYAYDVLGRRIATDGVKEDTTYAYDEVGNLVSQTTTGAYDLALEYAYDLSGRMTSESCTENGATLTSSYIYDALGQLTSFTRSDGQSESYAYDPVGNMTAKTQNGVGTTMRYNAANQLVSSVSGTDKTTYSYDANGNLTRSENAAGARSYAYNALNLLESFTREDSYTENYSYNANRLLSEIRTSEDLTTTLTWDILYGDGVVIDAAQNGKSTSYTYGLERISAITSKTRTEYVYDGRGSVVAEVSYNNAWYTFGGGLARKNVVSKSYSPFGELLTEQTSGFGYNGEYYNAATGMIYLRARFYEPEMNRFSQKDTLRGSIADPVSLNRYLYCQSDPVNFADYNGLQMVNVCVADGGGSGRRITPNQTTSIVTKPGQNSVSSANTASRMVAVPMTDTGTGGYSSAYSAAGAMASNGNGQGNQGTQTGMSQTSGITRESPSVQDVTGSERYSCGRDLQNSNANIENIMRFFGVSSPEDIPKLPENAMVVLENTRSIGPIVEGRAVVMDSDKYAEYVFFGVNWSLSGLGLSGKIFNGADISVTGDLVYNVNSPSDYAGVFIATSSVFEGISVGGAVSPGSNVYSTIMGGESQLAGSVTIVSGMYYFALSDEWIYDEAPISWYTKDNSNLRPDEQGAWY